MIYLSATADRSNPELAKLFVSLINRSAPQPDEGRDERALKVMIRPIAPEDQNFSTLPYLLYVDPGWQLSHDPEIALRPPDQFADGCEERFRLSIHRRGEAEVVVVPSFRAEGAWQRLRVLDGEPAELRIDLVSQLWGYSSFDTLELRTRGDRSAFTSLTICRSSAALPSGI